MFRRKKQESESYSASIGSLLNYFMPWSFVRILFEYCLCSFLQTSKKSLNLPYTERRYPLYEQK